jgi:hypothetical protein
LLLSIDFPLTHGWDKEGLGKIAKQIHARRLLEKLDAAYLSTIRLPRLLLLANFWSQFYLPAKYGYAVGFLAPAHQLFTQDDAELAVRHAHECQAAAWQLRHLSEEQLKALL